MPASALALALGAAFLHALWNLLLARAPDVQAATAVALVVGVVAFAPVAALAWEADAEVIPFLVVTALLQLTYFFLLSTAYSRAELSFVYPIARGSAPVLVLVGGLAILSESATATQVAGVVLVACGVLLVRGVRGPAAFGDLALALAIGVCIASYTLLDQRGIEHASPVVYQELSMIPVTLVVRRGDARSSRPRARPGGDRAPERGGRASRPSAPTSSSSPHSHARRRRRSRRCGRRAS